LSNRFHTGSINEKAKKNTRNWPVDAVAGTQLKQQMFLDALPKVHQSFIKLTNPAEGVVTEA
jgi:hypothetical protein